MAVVQMNLCEPRAIESALHRVRVRIPIIKIAGKADDVGSRGLTEKVDRLQLISGGVAGRPAEGSRCVHRTNCILGLTMSIARSEVMLGRFKSNAGPAFCCTFYIAIRTVCALLKYLGHPSGPNEFYHSLEIRCL